MPLISKEEPICGNLKKELSESPNLSTVIEIEKAIRTPYGNMTEKDLFAKMKGKISRQSMTIVLKYLEGSGKVVRDCRGTLVWTYNPGALARFRKMQKERLVLK